jgi:hypothetical protein
LDAQQLFSEDQVFSATADSTNTCSVPVSYLQTHNLVFEHGAISGVTPGSAEWTLTVKAGSTTVLTQVLGATAKRYNFVFDGREFYDIAGAQTTLKLTMTKLSTVGNATVTAYFCPQDI